MAALIDSIFHSSLFRPLISTAGAQEYCEQKVSEKRIFAAGAEQGMELYEENQKN